LPRPPAEAGPDRVRRPHARPRRVRFHPRPEAGPGVMRDPVSLPLVDRPRRPRPRARPGSRAEGFILRPADPETVLERIEAILSAAQRAPREKEG
jgi:hypothetical protein